MIPERDTPYPSLSNYTIRYVDMLYKNLRKRLHDGYNKENFVWVLGTEVIWELTTHYRGVLCPDYKTTNEKTYLYGIRVEEDRVNFNTIRLYEDITEFLEHD